MYMVEKGKIRKTYNKMLPFDMFDQNKGGDLSNLRICMVT